MSEPLVSVILPTYNRAHVLGRAVRSVLGQTWRDLELIVVDDGSTDGTQAVLGALGDERIRYTRRSNGGPAAARNTGLRQARGELIAFQDSDDEWLDGKLEQQVRSLQAAGEGTVLCVSGYVLCELGDAPQAVHMGSQQLLHSGDVRRQALEHFFFPTPTWLARRDSLEQCGGFDEALPCWEDWELAIRLAGVGQFDLVDQALLIQYRDVGGVNSKAGARMRALRRIIDLHVARWSDAQSALAQHWFTLGHLECRYGSIAEGRACLHRCTELDPGHIKARVALAFAAFDNATYRRLHSWSKALRGQHRPSAPLRVGAQILGQIDESE